MSDPVARAPARLLGPLGFAFVAARVFNTPVMIDPRKAEVIVGALRGHLGVETLDTMAQGGGIVTLDAAQLDALAADARAALPAAAAPRRRSARTRADMDKPYRIAPGGVAVLPIEGTLVARTDSLRMSSGSTGYDGLADMFSIALADPDVRGILWEIDSPGGEVGGVFDLADRIAAARAVKPIWAVATDYAFSAAYMLGSAASRLHVPVAGGVGSIGVIAMHVDMTRALEARGLKVTLVYAGARKADLTPTQPISEPALRNLQAEVDRLRGVFAQKVAANRGRSVESILATEAAALFGPGAIEAGLADKVANFDQTLDEFVDYLDSGGAGASGRILHPSATHEPETPGMTTTPTPPVTGGPAAPPPAAGPTPPAPAPQPPAPPAAPPAAGPTPQAPAQPDATAIAAARAEGATAERKRVGAILGSAEAQGREATARSLAFETDMSAEAAIKVLATTPKSTAGGFAAAMTNLGNPNVDASGSGQGDAEAVQASAARIAAFVNAPRRSAS